MYDYLGTVFSLPHISEAMSVIVMGRFVVCGIAKTNIADRRFQVVVADRWYKIVSKIIVTSVCRFGTTWPHRMHGSDSGVGRGIILLQWNITGGRHAILTVIHIVVRTCSGEMTNRVTFVAGSVFAATCHCSMGPAQAKLTLDARWWVGSWRVCVYIHQRYGLQMLRTGAYGWGWLGKLTEFGFWAFRAGFPAGKRGELLTWRCCLSILGRDMEGALGVGAGWPKRLLALWRALSQNGFEKSSLAAAPGPVPWVSPCVATWAGFWVGAVQGCLLVCAGLCEHLFLLDGDAAVSWRQVYWWLLGSDARRWVVDIHHWWCHLADKRRDHCL